MMSSLLRMSSLSVGAERPNKSWLLSGSPQMEKKGEERRKKKKKGEKRRKMEKKGEKGEKLTNPGSCLDPPS